MPLPKPVNSQPLQCNRPLLEPTGTKAAMKGIVETVRNWNLKKLLIVKESMLRVRNSVLLSLPYFDAIKHCALDPMHNLFMGAAKHVM